MCSVSTTSSVSVVKVAFGKAGGAGGDLEGGRAPADVGPGLDAGEPQGDEAAREVFDAARAAPQGRLRRQDHDRRPEARRQPGDLRGRRAGIHRHHRNLRLETGEPEREHRRPVADSEHHERVRSEARAGPGPRRGRALAASRSAAVNVVDAAGRCTSGRPGRLAGSAGTARGSRSRGTTRFMGSWVQGSWVGSGFKVSGFGFRVRVQGSERRLEARER